MDPDRATDTPGEADAPDGNRAPDAFGKYELLERIAVGGMAEIFRARSAVLGGVTRQCAIKRILPEYSSDRQFVSMFIDEARITIGLDHHNIVRLFDFGQVDGTYFMAMEFVDGADLVDVLRLHKRMGRSIPHAAAAFVAMCMCRGLHHAHVQKDHRGLPLGIVHRDVSPHNIFINWDGEVKLGDFGIASARNKITVTEAGTVKGKFAYMAPEQTTGENIDARADIWAVGVVLHELLSGARLFATDNPVLTIGRVNTMPIPSPSAKNEDVPTSIDHIAMKALERNLKQRYRNAEEMASDLERWLEREGNGYGQQDFADYLVGLDWSDNTLPIRRSLSLEEEDRTPSVEIQVSHLERDPHVDRLLGQLRKEPNLWTLVEIGVHQLKEGDRTSGLSAIRTAAAVFAHRGMLVQMICAFNAARAFLDETIYENDLVKLVVLRNNDRDDLEAFLRTHDVAGYWPILKSVDRKGLGGEGEDTNVLHPAPLFGRLPPQEFARLAAVAKVREVPVGTRVLTEGETSNGLYAVGRGRLVVQCAPGDVTPLLGDEKGAPAGKSKGEPIYLSALADGDFFGEFSFLTGRPRSATVETITDCVILELDQSASEQVLHADPAFHEPLLDFYKERVGELMMAKNPVFALLSPEDRRELLMRSQLKRADDQDLIIRQGEISEDMYFIKHGEVEVYRDDGGVPVFINKLREGEFFGEMAALHGTPRTASVRAMGEVELFCMSRSELDDILSRELEVKRLFEAAISWRAAETSARMAESRMIFEGT